MYVCLSVCLPLCGSAFMCHTICQKGSDSFYYSNLLYEMGHYFLDTHSRFDPRPIQDIIHLFVSVASIKKGKIKIKYQYNFGLPHGNSAFVTLWLEFDLLVFTFVQIEGFKR